MAMLALKILQQPKKLNKCEELEWTVACFIHLMFGCEICVVLYFTLTLPRAMDAAFHFHAAFH